MGGADESPLTYNAIIHLIRISVNLFFTVFRSVIDLIGKQGNSKCKHGCDDKQRHRTFIDVNVSQVNRYIACDVENNSNNRPLFFSG